MDLTELLFDMDGVLADLEGRVREILGIRYPFVQVPRPQDRRTFYLDEEMEENDRHLVFEIIAEKGFFANLRPISGAIAAVKRMARIPGVNCRICTSPLKNPGYCVDEKLQWLDRLMGPVYAREAIVTRDKTKVPGYILVDDKHEITGACTPTWEHVIQTQSHNRLVTGKRRVDLRTESGYRWLYEELCSK